MLRLKKDVWHHCLLRILWGRILGVYQSYARMFGWSFSFVSRICWFDLWYRICSWSSGTFYFGLFVFCSGWLFGGFPNVCNYTTHTWLAFKVIIWLYFIIFNVSNDFEWRNCLSSRGRVWTSIFVQWMCEQFSFLPKCTPGYFLELEAGIIIYNLIGGLYNRL